MITFARLVSTVAGICLLAQGSIAVALPNSNIQARSPFPESSIIPQLLTRADPSDTESSSIPDGFPSQCQSPCTAQGLVGCDDADCLCTNDVSQNVATCLGCITSNAKDSLSQEDAQNIMDALVAECKAAGKTIDDHTINGASGKSISIGMGIVGMAFAIVVGNLF
ncbi:hypothetical protein VKT23_009585 [Stygiomarasmius scandens]|uniref:Extracellular membrane protein CFEM domain-containing protein n=1 Tax=Marasmiellus scandens TaxID=2682957 RepID=A0ABR1JK43_9AGAR